MSKEAFEVRIIFCKWRCFVLCQRTEVIAVMRFLHRTDWECVVWIRYQPLTLQALWEIKVTLQSLLKNNRHETADRSVSDRLSDIFQRTSFCD